jgi:hypothetical protein
MIEDSHVHDVDTKLLGQPCRGQIGRIKRERAHHQT